MAQKTPHIRENLFQKQHAEAMQALIWALSELKADRALDTAKILEISAAHAAAFASENELAQAWKEIQAGEADKAIVRLKVSEEKYHEDLNRKATRHKLSIFFAFIFALGCGLTIAGSNFLIGLQYGWVENIGFLSGIVLISLPIIAAVTMANWWLGVRAVPDLENMNKDPYLMLEKRFGKPKNFITRGLFAIGIFGIEIFNALTFNFKKSPNEEKRSPWRFLWYFTVFAAAVIYAFFAFAATFKLGMGINELMIFKGWTLESTRSTAAIVSATAGLLAAIPTYMAMKIIYVLNADKFLQKGKGPFDLIREIPGYKKNNLIVKFSLAAFAVIIGVAFTTYAAVAPFAEWLKLAGMHSGFMPLSFAAIAVAFIGNIPFYVNTAAKSFQQYYDPREALNSGNTKWFPYIRFWNATLNAIPAIVGVLAFFGLLGLTGPGALIIPVAVNVLVAAAASYFANSNGSPTMYEFDPAKQLSKFQQLMLNKLSNNDTLTLYPGFEYESSLEVYDELTPMAQLNIEFVGAYSYLYEANNAAKMPELAVALHKIVRNTGTTQAENQLLHQALKGTVFGNPGLAVNRFTSAFARTNVGYTQSIFPYDYLRRIERFADEPCKRALYDAALQGGNGVFTSSFRQVLDLPNTLQTYKLTANDYLYDADAVIFWKAYETRSHDEQRAVIGRMADIQKKSDIRELLLIHSKPEIRAGIVRDKYASNLDASAYLESTAAKPEKFAYNLFKRENRIDLIPVAGFMMKNLAFPFMLAYAGLKQLFLNVPDKMDLYTYLTEGATEEVRKQFILDVLTGYANETGSHADVALILVNIINQVPDTQIPPDKVSPLKSGVLGRVLELCATLPDVKQRLLDALDESQAALKRESPPEDEEETLEPPRATKKGLFARFGLSWGASRPAPTDQPTAKTALLKSSNVKKNQ